MKSGEDRLKEHRNQIVRSPERVRKEIKDFSEATQRQKMELAEREEAARAFHAKIEHLKVLETVRVSLGLILEVCLRSELARVGKPCGAGNIEARSCRVTKAQSCKRGTQRSRLRHR